MTDDNMNQQSDQQPNSSVTWIAVGVIVLIIIAALVWWWISAGANEQSKVQTEPAQPEPVTQTVESEKSEKVEEPVQQEPESKVQAEPVIEPEREPEPEPTPAPELPELDESTPTILQTLDTSGLSIQPLKSSQLVRDAVVIIENLRNGTLVRERTVVQRPDGRFRVLEIDGELYIDEQTYKRYDALVDWFVSLDEQALVENYELFKPLMNEAFADIGYPDSDMTNAVYEAIDVLLDTPVPESLVQVKDDEVMYTYADPAYESLPPAQKQLLRMGPDNIKRIKSKLREIRKVLKANL
ncbi:DUF3014 domain-containing protein [Idiomarina seosinensis]|uniref:DUF3014 domain-containing protein n=1 Tax=Idiomarina seosinensis TaxID=281739 RepID=A0A432ZBD8_9GAMM|nr:DUF3014 domain-containing protein [Idiomarina seosinensis]RUO75277.1 DUF3014 domain-containing protein [Idiomarina seosinensis]